MKDIPIYDITIEDDAEIQGVSKISLVDVPAIGVNWIALRKVELKLQDVFGYETQHFDICPGAQATFKNYSQMQLDEDTIGMVRSAAQVADNVFEIEKKVIEAGRATSEDLQQVKTLVDDFKDIISEIDKITGQPQQVDYMDGHIKVVEDLLPNMMMAVRKKKPKMLFVKKECFACPPNGDGTKANGEPDRRCKGEGTEKGPKVPKNAGAKGPSEAPLPPKPLWEIDDKQAKADAIAAVNENTKVVSIVAEGKPTNTTEQPAKIVVLKDDVRRLLQDRIPPASSLKEGYYNNYGGYWVGKSSGFGGAGILSDETKSRFATGDFVEVRLYTSGPPMFHYNTKTGEYISHSIYQERGPGFKFYTSNKKETQDWLNKYL